MVAEDRYAMLLPCLHACSWNRPQLRRRYLARLREQMIKVPSPPGRVFALVAFANGGPIQNAVDPSTQPRRGFRLGAPKRLQHLRHQLGVDITDWGRDKNWRCVGCDCGLPLRSMLLAFPGAASRLDVCRGALVERFRSGKAERILRA